MKYLHTVTMSLLSLLSFTASASCNYGFVSIKKDLVIGMQNQGNPRGELRLVDLKKNRIIISAKNKNQSVLMNILKNINSKKIVCLQVDPTTYGDYKLEDFNLNSLGGIVNETFANNYFPQLFVIDTTNPFSEK